MASAEDGDVAVLDDRSEVFHCDLSDAEGSGETPGKRESITNLQKLVDLVQMRRHRPHEGVQARRRIAREDLGRVHLDNGDGDTEKDDRAEDEKEIPDASEGEGSQLDEGCVFGQRFFAQKGLRRGRLSDAKMVNRERKGALG